ncbi:MAG: lipopolysaccharide biosynthesis protein [Prevotella sp.]|nr:lipopolysaccharide biosynthesis protein [Prevotella sp.]
MGITMLVQLYTSRIVLNALGVDDYGIYNVVGSFIVAFTFISGPLGTATQRFLSFELGKGCEGKLNTVFNLSFYIYIILSLALLAIIEISGIWFIEHKMVLPEERMEAAVFAFHLSVLSLMFSLLKTPFESLIVAHEKMVFYAYMSIVDVLLKLLNAFSLLYIVTDKLKLYASNQLIVSIIVFSIIVIYCRRSFKTVKIGKVWDKRIFNDLLNFSGWSLFGSVASMTANQGLNILLNMFYGVAVNAAMGIANQINASVNQFVANFQVAFRPQIVKYYAAGDIKQLNRLIINSSKYSYLLLFALVCPFCFNIDFILELWLKNPPEWAAEFTIFMLIYALLETLSAPMWMTVQATGKIRNYQLIISCLIFMNIILSYVFLKLGFSPTIVLVIKCCLDVTYLITRILFMKAKVQFPVCIYMKEVLLRICIITVASLLVMYFIADFLSDGWMRIIVLCVVFAVLYFLLVYFIGINVDERKKTILFLKKKCHRL